MILKSLEYFQWLFNVEVLKTRESHSHVHESLLQIEKHKAVENRRLGNVPSRGGRGRGRGASRRGRPKVPKDKMSQLAAYFV